MKSHKKRSKEGPNSRKRRFPTKVVGNGSKLSSFARHTIGPIPTYGRYRSYGMSIVCIQTRGYGRYQQYDRQVSYTIGICIQVPQSLSLYLWVCLVYTYLGCPPCPTTWSLPGSISEDAASVIGFIQQQRWKSASKPERLPDRLVRPISQLELKHTTTTQQLLNNFCQTCEHPDVAFDFQRTNLAPKLNNKIEQL